MNESVARGYKLYEGGETGFQSNIAYFVSVAINRCVDSGAR